MRIIPPVPSAAFLLAGFCLVLPLTAQSAPVRGMKPESAPVIVEEVAHHPCGRHAHWSHGRCVPNHRHRRHR